MTKEEAITALKNLCEMNVRYNCDTSWVHALRLAIEALSIPEHDGCDGCRWEHRASCEEPCIHCKQNYMDLFEEKPSGTPMYDKDTNTVFVRKHGIWKFNPSVQMDKSWYICSVCGHDQVHESKFCPNCGSEMDVKI